MTTPINTDWMLDLRASQSYIKGVNLFLEFAKRNGGGEKLFSCPCKFCRNGKGKADLETISFHLLNKGIDESYTFWNFHGEKQPTMGKQQSTREHEGPRLEDMINDVYGVQNLDFNSTTNDTCHNESCEKGTPEFDVDPEILADKHYKDLKGKATEPLYPLCSDGHTTLSTIVSLQNLKTQFGWSGNSMTELLKLLKKLLPKENTLPEEYPKMKSMIKELGMNYEVIHACPNDCILYWKEHKDKIKCPLCNAPRFKVRNFQRKSVKKEPQKVLRHFPLIPRLKRLYTIPWIANAMSWHNRAETSTDIMRHPIDSIAWKSADLKWPNFAQEPRNVRLGIATDGFNPHGSMSTSYSCWPVIVVPYNLPPSMCMKREFSMMALLKPGPRAPGKDIDVYLQPLIDELKELWYDGVTTFDSYRKNHFTLKAMLLWAIHDFPAYGTLSGCNVHGYKACPVYAEETDSEHLKNSKKICYRGHRRFLPTDHKFRDDKNNFNKKVEHRKAPQRLSGSAVEQKVASIKFKPGKVKSLVHSVISGRKRKRNNIPDSVNDDVEPSKAYSRRSILFELPYWKEHKIRHCLDVMHDEKNCTEHLINTILEQKDKTKDGVNARKDMKAMGIKRKLWLVEDADTGRVVKPRGSFALEKDEKLVLCHTMINLKTPTGFSSNFSNNVTLQPPEVKGCKSHDYHVIMQHLLPLLIQHAFSKHKDLGIAIQQISLFFKLLCSKVVKRDDIISARRSLVEALCVLEKHFPPSFFVISIHLMVHLAEEVLICGPVRYRWMYPFEWLMKKYKDYVLNKRYIEGCIAEAYIVDESIMYCMEYMPNDGIGSHKHTRETFLDEDDECADEGPLEKGKTITLTQVQYAQVRRWVLQSFKGVDDWQKKYDLYMKDTCVQRQKGSSNDEFISWLCDELLKANDTKSTLWRLANGPLWKARTYSKYRVNGFIFSPSCYEATLVTQDSGICMRAFTNYRSRVSDTNLVEDFTMYYGVIQDIIELDYTDFKQTVFYCDWVKVEDTTNACKVNPTSKHVMVNLEKLKSKSKFEDEPVHSCFSSESSFLFK